MKFTLPDVELTKMPTRAPKHTRKAEGKGELKKLAAELVEWQKRLYAENKHSILVVLQGMDASGKDGLIRRVFSGINPQGVRVYSFKEPTKKELAHDFLWRIHHNTPERGMIHVFNRSHYEDVLVTRVDSLINDEQAKERFQAINQFETLLRQAGTIVLKFYLNVSEKEQDERLQKRIDDPSKQWKYEPGDDRRTKQWPEYRRVYEDVFQHCSPPECPWHVVPADQKWYAAHTVATVIRDALVNLQPNYPESKQTRPQ